MPQPSPVSGSRPPSASAPPGSSRRRRVPRDRSRRFALGLVAVVTTVSLLLGWGLASLTQARPLSPTPMAARPGIMEPPMEPRVAQAPPSETAKMARTVDYVADGYRLSQRLYLENCATCHIGVPPETLPSESWRYIIQDASHYGTEIQPLQDPVLGLVWSYLQTFSRQRSAGEARNPYRLGRSRYFKALHPEVSLPAEVSLENCATCHRAAQQFSFRPWQTENLTPESAPPSPKNP